MKYRNSSKQKAIYTLKPFKALQGKIAEHEHIWPGNLSTMEVSQDHPGPHSMKI
ncbi:MAG TPA: hypothetical protein GX004_09630 [Firmicutes bacterium]|jgi:hypothetical protein|nr:hypothetical protein [Bacillota bacterium]